MYHLILLLFIPTFCQRSRNIEVMKLILDKRLPTQVSFSHLFLNIWQSSHVLIGENSLFRIISERDQAIVLFTVVPWLPCVFLQLRLHLPSNCEALTATGSDLWPSGVPLQPATSPSPLSIATKSIYLLALILFESNIISFTYYSCN